MTKIIYIDEAGNTGPDLRNSAQPFLVVSSIALSEPECIQLKKEFFGSIRSDELKASNLLGSTKGRSNILDFLNAMSERNILHKSAIIDKEFSLIVQMVDLIVENACYEKEFDLYKSNTHRILANGLYFEFKAKYLNDESGTELLNSFQRLCREQSDEAKNQFDMQLHACSKNDHAPFLGFVVQCFKSIDILEYLNESTLDHHLSALYVILTKWYEEFNSPLRIVHDKSTHQQRRKDIIQKVNLDPERTISENIVPPFSTESFEFKDSIEEPGIQLADIIAGTLNTLCKRSLLGPLDEAWLELRKALSKDNCFIHATHGLVDVNSAINTEHDCSQMLEHLVQIFKSKS